MPVYVGRLECAFCGHRLLHLANPYTGPIEALKRLTSRLYGYSTVLNIPRCRNCEMADMHVKIQEPEHYIWQAAADGSCTHLGDRWFELTGHRPGADLGNDWMGSINPEDLPRLWAAHVKATETLQPYSMRYRLRRPNRTYAWMFTKGFPQFTINNSFNGFWGFAFEIANLE